MSTIEPRRNGRVLTKYPLFVVIPKDNAVPKFSVFGILAGKFRILNFHVKAWKCHVESLEISRSEKLPGKKAECFGITSSFEISTSNRG